MGDPNAQSPAPDKSPVDAIDAARLSLAVVGAALLTAGGGLIYFPLAFIVPGVLFLTVAVVGVIRS